MSENKMRLAYVLRPPPEGFYNAKSPVPIKRQLLVDVSAIVKHDLKTGIQRVVRSYAKELVSHPPEGYEVRLTYSSIGQHPKYADKYTTSLIDKGVIDGLVEDPMKYRRDDLYFILDLDPGLTWNNRALYESMKNAGVKIGFIVYDILPVKMPHCFRSQSDNEFKRYLEVIETYADYVIGISKSTIIDVEDWLKKRQARRISEMKLGWNHLGHDISESRPTYGINPENSSALQACKAMPSVLMVGTVEPRKGHDDALSACEDLWRRGVNFSLVIVGKKGWLVDELVVKLQTHQEQGRRLFFCPKTSDQELELFYSNSRCVLMASKGEGFGLPLIEAASRGKHVIARDIEVFREIGGEGVSYFKTKEDLCSMIEKTVNVKGDDIVSSANVVTQTWKQSVSTMMDMLRDDNHPQWISKL